MAPRSRGLAARLTPDHGPALDPQSVTLRSGLLPLIRARLQDHPRSRVVDFGLPTTNKLVYFSRCRSRIFWNNWPGGVGEVLRSGGAGELAKVGDIKQFFIPGDTERFDVILLWDYLEHISFPAARDLLGQLLEYYAPGCWVYFLISQSSGVPIRPADIDITLDHCLRYTTVPEARTAPRYAPKVMEQAMPGFQILKLYLMKNGVQEHLFRFAPGG